MTISNNKEKAECLSQQFSSVVFTREDTSSIPDIDSVPVQAINDLIIHPDGVLKQLNGLKPNKAPGPDQIPPWLIGKLVAEELTPVLTDLFQTSIDTGKVPSQWKEANITGIFKKGDSFKPANYRPVSLTRL